MAKLNKAVAMLLVLTMVSPLAAGCQSGAGGNTGAQDATKTLKIGIDSDIAKIDPAQAYDFTTNPVMNQITQGLMYYDKNDALVPLLAKEWAQVDDLTYTYKIRDDVKFSDGTPMTMDDVVYSLNRHFDPSISLLVGNFENCESITATGDWELTVKLKTPDISWINVLAGTSGHIVKKEYCEANGEVSGSGNNNASSKVGSSQIGIIGTGPYMYKLGSWTTNTGLTLVKNENYWKTGDEPYYETLDIKVVSEATTAVTAIQSGAVDVLTLPPPALLDTLYNDANVNVLEQSSYGLVYLALNHQKKPFDNPLVAEALSHAINFAEIHDALIKRAGDMPTSLPTSLSFYKSEPQKWSDYLSKAPKYEYDVEKAKALLTQAGYPNGFEISLMTNEDGMRNAICVAIQAQLELVGIKVNINKVNGSEHTSYQFGAILDANGLRGYDMLLAGWSGDFPDITQILKPLYRSGQAANAAVYANTELDKLIDQQGSEKDPAKRNEILFKAMDIITKDLPYLIVTYPIKTYAVSNKIAGIDTNVNWVANVHFQDARPAGEAK